MKNLTVFFKQLRLSQLLTAFLATVVVFFGAACNSGTVQGARPENPPVQAGGANNPYKGGGDSNTNYNFSPDPKINGKASSSKGDRADLEIISNRLIAVSNKAQYPGEASEFVREGANEAAQQEVSAPKTTKANF